MRRLAARARGPVRLHLLRAVAVHAQLRELELPRKLQRRIDRAFDEVARRAERGLEHAQSADEQLADGVSQLTRVARAARAREKLIDGLSSTRGLAVETDALEAEVAALAELA